MATYLDKILARHRDQYDRQAAAAAPAPSTFPLRDAERIACVILDQHDEIAVAGKAPHRLDRQPGAARTSAEGRLLIRIDRLEHTAL